MAISEVTNSMAIESENSIKPTHDDRLDAQTYSKTNIYNTSNQSLIQTNNSINMKGGYDNAFGSQRRMSLGLSRRREVKISQPVFDAEKHLAIEAPTHKVTFEELGLSRPSTAASPVAGTSPFPLFSTAAIPLLRQALLDPTHLNKTASIYGANTMIIRDAAAHSQFYRDIWTHPKVMRAVSDAAGVELELFMETMEIGHANVQVDMKKYNRLKRQDMLEAISADLTAKEFLEAKNGIRREVTVRAQEDIDNEVNGDGGALIPWHYDSYPFVCVAMLSDTSEMVGGETVIQRGDGVLQGISQPGMGSAMVLQGGFVKHLALRAAGSTDRITMVSSYRAKAVGLYDFSFLTNVRPYTDLTALYAQWQTFRNKVLDENIKAGCKPSDSFIVNYHRQTQRQMVPAKLINSLVKKYGMPIFYSIIDDYKSGAIFEHAPSICPRCYHEGGIDKEHINSCEKAREWMNNSSLWDDVEKSRKCLKTGEAVASTGRPDIVEVVENFKTEGRQWGMADELAVQGLTEYLLEYLSFFGVEMKAN